MPLYKCTKCGCRENTSLTNFHQDNWEGAPVLCSECDPAIGRWHGKFEKVLFTPEDEAHTVEGIKRGAG